MITDTHTHIYTDEFNADRNEVVKRAIEAGVTMMLLPNIDVESIEAMKRCAKQYPQNTRMMMGLHPSSVDKDFEKDLNIIKNELDSGQYIAVGEIGIDLYWDKTYKNEQIQAFKQQCLWAIDKNLPISIHSRDSYNEVIATLKSLPEIPKGIFHCFGGNLQQAQEVTEMGLLLGIGGVLTFKNSKLGEVVKRVSLQHIVVETDAPYLAPHPYRGKRNEPAYTSIILTKLAEIHQISMSETEKIIDNNIKQLFKL